MRPDRFGDTYVLDECNFFLQHILCFIPFVQASINGGYGEVVTVAKEYHCRHVEQLVDFSGNPGKISAGVAFTCEADTEKDVRINGLVVEPASGKEAVMMFKIIFYELEDKINREILPFLKGYKKTWEFRFIQEMELDDKQKVAQTGAIRMGSITAGLGAGIPARLAYKIANDESLSKSDLEDLDEAKQNAMMQEMGGEGGNDDILGDQEQGRYGQGSEMYQPTKISDYGQGGENTEQRMGNKEEVEYKKARFEPGDEFYKSGLKYEIISANENFAKARVYLQPGQAAPEGRTVRQGNRGRSYYLTTLKQQATKKKKKHWGSSGGSGGEEEENEHSAPAPEIEGAQKMVRVTGNGVGIVAGIVDGKLIVKSLKNKETGEFIKKVIAAGGSEEKPGQFLAAMKEVAKSMDLNISA